MRLSKTERIYKKRLFAVLKIKRRKNQKEYTAMLTKTETFKKYGFRGVYQVYRTAIPRLSKAMVRVAEMVTEVVRGFTVAARKIAEAVANFAATSTEDKHQEE